jgi:hypothetical protein
MNKATENKKFSNLNYSYSMIHNQELKTIIKYLKLNFLVSFTVLVLVLIFK